MQDEIVIIGAGIGGLTLAKSLEQKGIPFQLFEQSNSFEASGFGIQSSPNVNRVFNALGLKEKVATIAHRCHEMEVRTFESDKILLRNEFLGDVPYYQLRRADMHEMLFESIEDKSNIHFSKRCEKIKRDKDGVTLQFTDGSQAKTEALVAADGIKSSIRHILFPTHQEKYSGYLAFRALLPFTEKYNQLKGKVTVWMGADHHVVAYPNGNDKMKEYWLNLVLVEKNTTWNEAGWTIPADKETVAKMFRNNSNLLNQILDDMIKSPNPCFKWGLFIHEPLPYWTDKTITLLGDAAHPMVPFQAQGAAMAIEDGYILADCIAKYNTIEEAFAEYEKLRKVRATTVQLRSYQNGEMFHASGVKKLVRNTFFRVLNKISPNFLSKRLEWLYDYDATKIV